MRSWLALRHLQLRRASTLTVGEEFTVRRAFTADDVASFVRLTGDSNPLHTQPAAARAAGLSGCLTPGLLAASLFPALIGSQLEVSFRAVAPVGATLHASVTATRLSGRKVVFSTRCVLEGSGELVMDGTALALLPETAETATA